MKDIDIIIAWLSVSANQEKIPILAFSSEVYEYIKGVYDAISVGECTFYRVGSEWVKIIKKEI